MWIVDLAGSERSKRTSTFTKIAQAKKGELYQFFFDEVNALPTGNSIQ